MSRFYDGAERIEKWMDKPRVDRFMDALTIWYMTLLAVVAAGFVVALAVVGLVSVIA